MKNIMMLLFLTILLIPFNGLAENDIKFSFTEFLDRLNKNSHFRNSIKKINQDIIRSDIYYILGSFSLFDYYSDSLFNEHKTDTFLINEVMKNEHLNKLLSRQDILYMQEQFNSNRDTIWNINSKTYTLIDTNDIDAIYKNSIKREKNVKIDYYYSFSKPLFSIDGNYVVFECEYCCGFMCSSTCSYLCKKVREKWEILDMWNCWSD